MEFLVCGNRSKLFLLFFLPSYIPLDQEESRGNSVPAVWKEQGETTDWVRPYSPSTLAAHSSQGNHTTCQSLPNPSQAGAFMVLSIILMRETSAPVILERKAARLRASTGNPKLRSKLASDLSPRDLFKFSIIRPVKMLTRSPICLAMSVYVAITYAYLYILFTTFTAVFSTQYHWHGGVVGLSFLGLGVGSLVGQFVFTRYGNKTAAKHIAAGDFRPEHRLYIMAGGGFFLPIGLFWYGWSVQAQTHYMVPIVGTGVIGFGLVCALPPRIEAIRRMLTQRSS